MWLENFCNELTVVLAAVRGNWYLVSGNFLHLVVSEILKVLVNTLERREGFIEEPGIMKKIVVLIIVVSLALSNLFVYGESGNINKKDIVAEVEEYLEQSNSEINFSIERIKKVDDFYGNKYIVVECQPTGFFIYHENSGEVSEYSISSMSPFKDLDGKLLYGGQTQYYEKMKDQYRHCVTDQVIMDKEVIKSMKKRSYDIAQAFDQKSISDPSMSLLSTDTYVDHEYIFQNLTSSYDMGFYSGGYCGYIASNLVLFYHHKTNWQNFVDADCINGMKLAGSKLTQQLIDIGDYYGYGNLTTHFEIRNVVMKYCSDRNLNVQHYWATLPSKDQMEYYKVCF